MESAVLPQVGMVTISIIQNKENRKDKMRVYLESGQAATGLTSKEYHKILSRLEKYHDDFSLIEGKQT